MSSDSAVCTQSLPSGVGPPAVARSHSSHTSNNHLIAVADDPAARVRNVEEGVARGLLAISTLKFQGLNVNLEGGGISQFYNLFLTKALVLRASDKLFVLVVTFH